MARDTARAMGFAFSGFAVFALHDAIIKSVAGYSVFQIVFFAVLFGYVPFSVSLVADKNEGNLRPVNPGWVLLRTGCMVGSTIFAFFAFRTLELAQTYALLFASPIVITLLAIPLLGERVRLARSLAIALGTIGVLVALRPSGGEFGLGHLSALLAVLCSALSAVVTRRIAHSERSATLILFPLLANVGVSGSVLAFVYVPMAFNDLAKLAAVGTLAMAGQYFIIQAYRCAPAALVAPFQYSQMLWAVIFGYFWFGEVPDTQVFVGAAIIILAGLLILWRESTANVSSNRPFSRTRNIRATSAAPMRPSETDEQPIDAIERNPH